MIPQYQYYFFLTILLSFLYSFFRTLQKMGIWIEKKWHLPQFMSLAQNPNRGHSPLQRSHSQKAENTFCIVQVAQSRALWWPRWWHGGRGWGRGPREREYMYAYSWFIFFVQQKPTQHCKASISHFFLKGREWGICAGVFTDSYVPMSSSIIGDCMCK